MELTNEDRKKYLDIVKNGNMDDMYDFGVKQGRLATLEEVEREIEEKLPLFEKATRGTQSSALYATAVVRALKDVLEILSKLKNQ